MLPGGGCGTLTAMDGISPVAGTMDIAAGGTSAVAMAVLASTEQFAGRVAAELFASLGVGANVDASA